jgi:translation initiation factor IF-3
MLRQKKFDLSSKFKVNEEIKLYGNVRIVGEGIESRIVPISEARKIAEEMELDLVDLGGKQETPVLKICNYEKMVYEMKKAAKRNKQSAKPLKEIQLRTNIADHDLGIKAQKAREFLESGSRVRVVLTIKGRELLRREESKKPILKFIVSLDDIAIPESELRDEGNKTSIILKKRQ